jgi:hypothetical protein
MRLSVNTGATLPVPQKTTETGQRRVTISGMVQNHARVPLQLNEQKEESEAGEAHRPKSRQSAIQIVCEKLLGWITKQS